MGALPTLEKQGGGEVRRGEGEEGIVAIRLMSLNVI